MKKRIKLFIGIALMLVCVAGGAVGTLAYLKATTAPVTNTFASSKKISLALRENLWDGYTFEDAVTQNGKGIKAGLTAAQISQLGYTQAHNYVPGQNIAKNPTVKNTGDANGVAMYTAVKVEYKDAADAAMTYAAFKNTYLAGTGISFNGNWNKIDSDEVAAFEKCDVYLYQSAVPVGGETTALFTQIPLSTDLMADETTGLLPGFSIEVTAYAIQTEGLTDDINATMLNFVTSK